MVRRILGIGIDLLSVSRFDEMVKRRGVEPVARRILSLQESMHLKMEEDQVAFLRNRFSIKEALFKACSIYTPLQWKEVTILKENNRPMAILENHKELCAKISLSHDGGFVAAVALVEIDH